ncbi:GTP-binding protein [archaeon]|nr:MAG: GTP-binding protein [archaeon]
MTAKCLKVLEFTIIGDSGVGKSSLLMRFVENKFSPIVDPTVGAEFVQKIVKLMTETVKIRVWDNTGVRTAPHHAESYCKSSQALFVCFDIISRETFENLSWWLKLGKENAPTHALLVLVACKADLKDEREVSSEEISIFAEKNRMMYFEVSSKDPSMGSSLETMFSQVIALVHNINYSFRSAGYSSCIISGASSWFNRNSINGRYIPESEMSGSVLYRNMDCHGATMQYEAAMKGWVIRKHHRKVLAALPSTQPISGSIDISKMNRSGKPQGWKESAGIFLAWLFISPHMRCEEYTDERMSMLPARAPVIFSRPSSNIKPNANDDHAKEDFEIIIDMMLFAQYSREPEHFGLDIPLFVRYCVVQLDILIYELHVSLKESNRESDYDRMQHMKDRRNDLLSACQQLLSTISKNISDIIPNNSLSLSSTIIDRSELIGTISELCGDMSRRFDALCNMETGNFLAAKQCSATRKELLDDLQRIRDGKRSSLNYYSQPPESPQCEDCLQDTFDSGRVAGKQKSKGSVDFLYDSHDPDLTSDLMTTKSSKS